MFCCLIRHFLTILAPQLAKNRSIFIGVFSILNSCSLSAKNPKSNATKPKEWFDLNSKMKMLHLASKFMNIKEELIHIYKTYIRSRHSSLTKNNEMDIERVQKAALKVILKDKYINYDKALRLLDLESLHVRRERLCLKFAKKCLKLENFKSYFLLESQSMT